MAESRQCLRGKGECRYTGCPPTICLEHDDWEIKTVTFQGPKKPEPPLTPFQEEALTWVKQKSEDNDTP